MMTDYIKRTDAVKIAEKYGLANGSVLGRHTGLADCIASEISGLPAADVAEVVHGRWIDGAEDFTCGNHNAECSICRCYVSWDGCDEDFNYCPNCGARMDGGNDNVSD